MPRVEVEAIQDEEAVQRGPAAAAAEPAEGARSAAPGAFLRLRVDLPSSRATSPARASGLPPGSVLHPCRGSTAGKDEVDLGRPGTPGACTV